MKKIHKIRSLTELCDRLESRDFDRRENALFELAIMLRRANRVTRDEDPLSAADLPRELSRIRLSLDDQRDFADRLIQLVVSRRECRASAFWALGEVAASVGWEPALYLLEACGDQLDTEAAFQACRALRFWLESGKLSDEQIQMGIAACDPQPLLRKWSMLSDTRLSHAAQDLTERLNAAAN